LGAEASVACRRVLQQLLQQDWGSQVLSRLKALLSPQGDGGAATAAASAAAAGAALAVVAPVAEGGSCTHVVRGWPGAVSNTLRQLHVGLLAAVAVHCPPPPFDGTRAISTLCRSLVALRARS
jgi:hypothetical protein